MDEKLELTYEELVTFMKNAPANIFFKDTECKYRFVSEICDMVNGGAEHSILGKTDPEIQVYKEFGDFYYQDDLKILATGEGSQYVSEIPTPEGTVYFEIRKNPVIVDGKTIGIVGIVDDITERKRMEKKLEELSFRDNLTGLYNRNYLDAKEKEIAETTKFPVSVIMADCNYLKKTNDTYGHEYGDLLLRRVARILEECRPVTSVALRIGGDEFMLICNECPAEKAQQLIEKLQEQFAAKRDDRIPLSVAMGSYTAEQGPFSLQYAYHCADQEMYRNKQAMRQNGQAE